MSYIHQVPGRVRVRSELLASNPSLSGQLRRKLTAVEGVNSIKFNKHAKSMTVCFDHDMISSDAICEHFKECGCFCQKARKGKPAQKFVANVMKAAVQAQVQRSLVNFILP